MDAIWKWPKLLVLLVATMANWIAGIYAIIPVIAFVGWGVKRGSISVAASLLPAILGTFAGWMLVIYVL